MGLTPYHVCQVGEDLVTALHHQMLHLATCCYEVPRNGLTATHVRDIVWI